MKSKILAALKTKHSDKGFGQKAMDGVAEYLSKTITDESQIETAVAGVEPLLKVFQSEADAMRTEIGTLKQKNEELEKKAKETSPANGGAQGKGEPEDWRTAFEAYKNEQEEKLNALRTESETLKAEKARADRNNLITSKAKELGIPEWRIKQGFVIADDADEASIVESLTAIRTDMVTAGLGGRTGFPLAGGGKASKEEVDQIVAGMPM